MKRNKRRDFRGQGYSVKHEERTGLKCILFCTYGGREYAEIVLNKTAFFENEELLKYNSILFVEAEPAGRAQMRYTFYYQGTRKTTVILAESMEFYQSGYLISEIGRYAAEEWNKRHICLPSLMTAILLLEADSQNAPAWRIKELVQEHTDYLATWKERGTSEENWKSLWGKDNYVLAVQYLQKETGPYFRDKKYEELLIQTIEENKLTRFDFPYLTFH